MFGSHPAPPMIAADAFFVWFQLVEMFCGIQNGSEVNQDIKSGPRPDCLTARPPRSLACASRHRPRVLRGWPGPSAAVVFPERLFPEPRRARRGVEAAGLLPGFVVLPVGQHRLVEGGRVAFQRVLVAEEMAAGRHAPDRFEPSSSSLTAMGGRNSIMFWSISTSRMNFSKEAVSPPSCQPAA